MRTPFKLRSASPFKADDNTERMVHSEGGKNLLKDVNVKKGKKSIYTYKKMHADLLAKGMSQGDADKEVQKARGFNQEEYGTQNPTKEGKTENYKEEKGSMTMKDVASPGTEAKEGQDGAMMDSFSPSETRSLIRERKINKNRKDKYENKNRRQTGRYDKALEKSGLSKEEFDLTKKGKRMSMRTAQSQENIDDYTTGYKRSQMANQQGVNHRDGTQVQNDPDNVGLQKRTASTEATPGTATTEATAADLENLKNTANIDLGQDTSDSSYTESLSGGDGGSTDTDSSAETTETGNSSLKDAAGKIKATLLATSLGPMGQMLNMDADGDGDTILNDKNNDGTMLSRFMNKITGGDDKDAQMVGSGATKYGRKGGAPFKMTKNK
tara:strand:+ start:928 stop:2073 length:1146 start_codon:yes stop_codon:yes gene_type:complete